MFIARRQREAYLHPTADVVQEKTFRLIDLHVNSVNAQQAQFAPKISRLLDLIFEQQALAFQSLTFLYGSQQGIHQDGAYVVVSEPLKFAASWIALEDVTEGSGELLYYPGSHRLKDYLFSGKYKSWEPARDGQEANREFIKHLRRQVTERSLTPATFLPRQGDALIWAADLVHGGNKITNNCTRRSFVTHYCPLTVEPKYKSFSGTFNIVRTRQGGHFASRHYDLRDHAPIHHVNSRYFAYLRPPAFMGAKSLPNKAASAVGRTKKRLWSRLIKRRSRV